MEPGSQEHLLSVAGEGAEVRAVGPLVSAGGSQVTWHGGRICRWGLSKFLEAQDSLPLAPTSGSRGQGRGHGSPTPPWGCLPSGLCPR